MSRPEKIHPTDAVKINNQQRAGS